MHDLIQKIELNSLYMVLNKTLTKYTKVFFVLFSISLEIS